MREISPDMRIAAANITPPVELNLFDIDLTDIGGDVLRFYSGLNGNFKPVVWQGNTYTPYPFQASGFDIKSNGTSNRPKLTFANIDGFISSINKQYDNATGAIVTRRRVFDIHLDEVNFEQGNPQADPTKEAVSKYIIELKSDEDPDFVTYTLAIPAETDGALIPARTIQANMCSWIYRSADCGYSGPAVADEKDQPTNDLSCDRCSKKLSGCQLRHLYPQPLPFGGFPGADKMG